MTATTTRPRLRAAASVLPPQETTKDCTCGSPACLSRQDVTSLAHMIVSTYIEADDATAERVRALYGIPGPRPAAAAERWYSRWAGDLAEALARRAHPRVRGLAAEAGLAFA